MSNHTPAPWLLFDTDKRFVYALNEYGTNVFQAHVCGPNTKMEELEANARLIAAAPELLEALVNAGNLLHGMELRGMITHMDDIAIVEAVRASIAKAKG